jgi:hypothetical protein
MNQVIRYSIILIFLCAIVTCEKNKPISEDLKGEKVSAIVRCGPEGTILEEAKATDSYERYGALYNL